MRNAFSVLLLLCACVPSLEVPDDIQVECTSSDDCPDGFSCVTELRLCISQDRPDIAGPTLLAAVPKSAMEVEVSFDEAISQRTLETAVFSIAPTLMVNNVVPIGTQGVLLETASHTPGTTYTLTVSGVTDLSGNIISAPSDEATFVGFGVVPDGAPPELISPNPFAIVRGTSATFFWGARLAAGEYFLEVSADSDFATSEVFTVGDSLSHTVTTLPAETTVYWRVWADTTTPAVGESDPRTAAVVRTLETLGDIIHVWCASGESCAPPTPGEPLSLDTLESGNLSTPFRSIDRAIRSAETVGITEVRVADRGSGAAYAESVSVPGGIVLEGRYDTTFSGRTAPRTGIQNAGTVVRVSGALGATTLIDGFQIQATNTPTEEYSTGLLIVDSDDSLTVSDCSIQAGSARLGSAAVSLVSTAPGNNSGPLITGSSLESGPAFESFAVTLSSGAANVTGNNILSSNLSPTQFSGGLAATTANGLLLSGNSIIVPGAFESEAIRLDDRAAGFSGLQTIQGNTVFVGNSPQRASGIVYRAGFRTNTQGIGNPQRVTIAGNKFYTGTSTDGFAMFLVSNNVELDVVNNVIFAEGPFMDFGGILHTTISITGGQNAVFAHNTVLGGDCTACAFATSLQLNSVVSTVSNRVIGAAPAVYNNLFVGRTPTKSVGIFEEASFADPSSMLNNVFVNTNTAVRTGGGASLSVASVNGGSLEDVCIGSPFTWDTGCTFNVTLETAQASSNVASGLTLAQIFVDADGADNQLGTLDDDYRLLTNDAAITDGGFDTASANCGYVGESLSCGDIATDLNNVSRDTTPSVGAFEKL